ncbi:hypothetical protein FQA39_LY12036 [Lamprigera yunnana]|nr:hypothetical protein FQA39_LY12036 [Lamprigera yunnana]
MGSHPTTFIDKSVCYISLTHTFLSRMCSKGTYLLSTFRKQNTSFSQLARKKKKAICDIIVLGFAEFLGTALLLFLGCMGCVTSTDMVPVPHHLSGLIFGFVVLLIIQLLGHISGAHLNPAVTFSSAIRGQIRPLLIPIYVFSQFMGALVGFRLLTTLLPEEFTTKEYFDHATNQTVRTTDFCCTLVHAKLTWFQALVLETIITTVLVLVCWAVWDKRNEDKTDSTAVRFGFVIAVLSMVAGPFTGASMNTARSFAPALFNNNWDLHWVYWVGPNVGAVIGTYLYKWVFENAPEEDLNEDKLNNTEDIPLHENNLDIKNIIV